MSATERAKIRMKQIVKITIKRKLNFAAAAMLVTSVSANATTEQNLWGFRCSSPENKTVTTIALKDSKVVSVTVHPEIDGQIHYSRTMTLQEIGADRYANAQANTPPNIDPNTSEDDYAAPKQVINYEMSFRLDTQKEEAPKIEEVSLKENGIAPVNMDCSPIFKTKVANR